MEPLKVLLVGGPEDVAREVRARLAKYGLHLAYHHPWKRSGWVSKPFPQDTGLVIILKDMISHGAYHIAKEKAVAGGLRAHFVVTQRKWVAMYQALRRLGVLDKGKPLVLDDRGMVVMEEPEEKPQVDEAAVAREKILTEIRGLLRRTRVLMGQVGLVAVLLTEDGTELQFRS